MFNRKLSLIAIGDVSIDNFLAMDRGEAEVHCSVDRTNCQICLRYADKIPVAALTKTIGGNSGNVAVGMSRLQFPSALVTNLGKDHEAQFIIEGLKKDKVGTQYITYDKRTNLSTVINFQGERTILIYHEERTYQLPRLAKTDWVYLSSMKKGWEAIIQPLSTYLDTTNAHLAYNPGTYQLRAGLSTSDTILKRCTILFLNREEAALYLGLAHTTPVLTMLFSLAQLGPKIVVITDGPQGSYALDATGAYFVGIFPVPIIERTGCGDAYATGFLAAIAKGSPLPQAMRWGSFNAASVLQQIGPQAGLLTSEGMAQYEATYQFFTPTRIK